MGKWIWKFGEFEKYHSMLLHGRRHNYGYPEPPVWKIYPVEPAVRFTKEVHCQGGDILIHALGDISVSLFGEGEGFLFGECKLWGERALTLPAGDYRIQVRVMNTESFPAIRIDGAVETDETWLADDCTGSWTTVGTSPLFDEVKVTLRPDVFPFSYEEKMPTAAEPVTIDNGEQGYLYDFGNEMFGRIHISGLQKETPVRVILGESREEAMSAAWGYTRFLDAPKEGELHYPAYAFRYIFVQGDRAQVRAEAEMLPLVQRGEFRCEEKVINDVYRTAEYTFHLNAREFYLDGIKRDRWVWSADAYQSYFVNHYLYLDQETEKRTITSLAPSLPVVQYANTIIDYSYFWLISLWDYYVTYGDRHFLFQIYPQAKAVMEFCRERRSEDGFIRGGHNDWVFIDWAPMDKEGAVLGEQILLAKAMECFGKVEALVMEDTQKGRAEEASRLSAVKKPEHGPDNCLMQAWPKATGIDWQQEAERLRQHILEKYYDTEKGVFIDSFETGRKNVTRQNNLLAYLYLDIPAQIRKNIYERVVCDPEVTAITTPYFKFYENQVICEEGDDRRLEESLRDYYGSMLALGATTLYEQYDPAQKGAEHYAMYGRPFEKSLCHAWSCSPIYLLGRYRLGVRNTGVAYDSFVVEPKLGDLQSFEGTVPLPKGEVHVGMDKEKVTVLATAPGGTLRIQESEYELPVGKEVTYVFSQGSDCR